jgi:tetratricopeptide (TPR) repeat protein
MEQAAQGDYAGAIDTYTRALRANPQDATAYYQRGLARFERKDYTEAIADFADAYHNRAPTRSHTERGDASG